MNGLKKAWYRSFQFLVNIGGRFLYWRKPIPITGAGSTGRIPELLRDNRVTKVMVVTGRHVGRELAPAIIENIQSAGISCVHFSEVEANPSTTTVFKIRDLYLTEGCNGFLAIGGGSPMDAAKAAAALVVRPHKPITKMGGLFKVMHKLPPFIAVPTTAGTGSETTIAAVVTGADHHKYAINDLRLIPRCAVLDPLLTVSLPPHTTAETGMDALTHAVEAYIGRFYHTRQTDAMAEEAVVTIFRTLAHACAHGDDVEARQALLTASYQAGVAFTRAGVGNVHAIAHTLGGLYGVGHGLANAVLLPVVLRDYGTAAHRRLARLAGLVGLDGDTEAARANAFIDAIFAMNARLGIPTGFTCIREADLPQMAAWAAKEANPTYPVPVIYDRARFIRVIRQVMQ